MKFPDFLPKSAVLLAALAISACQQQAPAGEDGGPDGKPGLEVTEGVLVLPAVKGNPGAAYFTLSNASDTETSLAAVHIDGAGKTELHESKDGTMERLNWVQLQPGEKVTFARGGKHVMAFDLDDKLAPGGTAEMTITFSGGDKISAPLKIESVGGAGAASKN